MHICGTRGRWVNTLRAEWNDQYFAHKIFKCIFLEENICISIEMFFNCFHKCPKWQKVSFDSGNGLVPYQCWSSCLKSYSVTMPQNVNASVKQIMLGRYQEVINSLVSLLLANSTSHRNNDLWWNSRLKLETNRIGLWRYFLLWRDLWKCQQA